MTGEFFPASSAKPCTSGSTFDEVLAGGQFVLETGPTGDRLLVAGLIERMSGPCTEEDLDHLAALIAEALATASLASRSLTN